MLNRDGVPRANFPDRRRNYYYRHNSLCETDLLTIKIPAMAKNRPLLLIILIICLQSSAFALVGGRLVTERDPSGPSRSVVLVQIKRDGTHISSCTGTLIARNALLTAAHCFDQYLVPGANSFDVAFDIFENGLAKRVYLPGTSSKSHPRYVGSGPTPRYLEFDIAVAFFEGEIPDGMAPVQIDKSLNSFYGGKTVQVFGYGRSVDYRKTSNPDPAFSTGTLRTASIKYEMYSSIRHMYFTTNDAKTSAYLCQGDSGGPQFLVTSKGFKLIGVTSAGGAVIGGKGSMTCLTSGSVASVAPASKWIEERIKGL